MIKQIKPNSLSHKFLSLIFEDYEIRHGINICDVPWRALRCLTKFLALSVVFILAALVAIIYVVSLISAIVGIWYVPVWGYKMVELGLSFWLFNFVVVLLVIFQEASGGKVTLLPSYIKKATPKEPSPPSVLSLWWTSFKEKTCFKIVVDNTIGVEEEK